MISVKKIIIISKEIIINIFGIQKSFQISIPMSMAFMV